MRVGRCEVEEKRLALCMEEQAVLLVDVGLKEATTFVRFG